LDDLDQASLRQAVQRSLEYVRHLPQDRAVPFGGRQLPAATLQQTLTAFAQILSQAPTPAALSTALYERFDVVQAAGRDQQGTVLFTGYHEILLEGSRVPTPDYPYPLYRRPPDLLEIDLGAFHTRYAGERLMARYAQGKVLPYFTRRDIDSDGRLQGHGLELAWLRDAVDGFFLHVLTATSYGSIMPPPMAIPIGVSAACCVTRDSSPLTNSRCKASATICVRIRTIASVSCRRIRAIYFFVR
jgi:membrane-bound lytic murein transglycosylase A